MPTQTALEWFLENLPQRYKNALMNDFRYGVEQAKLMEADQLSRAAEPENKQSDSWQEIEDEFSRDEYPPFGGPFTNALTPWQWLSTWYHPPQRKK